MARHEWQIEWERWMMPNYAYSHHCHHKIWYAHSFLALLGSTHPLLLDMKTFALSAPVSSYKTYRHYLSVPKMRSLNFSLSSIHIWLFWYLFMQELTKKHFSNTSPLTVSWEIDYLLRYTDNSDSSIVALLHAPQDKIWSAIILY